MRHVDTSKTFFAPILNEKLSSGMDIQVSVSATPHSPLPATPFFCTTPTWKQRIRWIFQHRRQNSNNFKKSVHKPSFVCIRTFLSSPLCVHFKREKVHEMLCSTHTSIDSRIL